MRRCLSVLLFASVAGAALGGCRANLAPEVSDNAAQPARPGQMELVKRAAARAIDFASDLYLKDVISARDAPARMVSMLGRVEHPLQKHMPAPIRPADERDHKANGRAIPMAEVDQVVARRCTQRSGFGGVIGAEIAPGMRPVISIRCQVGHVSSGPAGECTRNCGYDLFRTPSVMLSAVTVRRLSLLGCPRLSACQGKIGEGSYPLSITSNEQGRVDRLSLAFPALELRYADENIGAWLLERRSGSEIHAWAGAIVLTPGGGAQDSALFISRKSFVLPSLRRAMRDGFGCGNFRLVPVRQISALSIGVGASRTVSRAALLKLFQSAPLEKDC